MFNGKKYLSRQANGVILIEFQILMWNMIDELKFKMELDYLKIFRLKKKRTE